MVDIPTPTVIGAYLDDVAHATEQIRESYRWAFPNTWQPTDHGHSGSRASSQRCSRCHGEGLVPRAELAIVHRHLRVMCPDCAGAGALPTSEDRVAAQMVATERYRKFIRHAAREVVDARNRLQGAVADLNDALTLLDPPPGPAVADVRLLPHPADAGDVRRARAAQERRQQRADGIPVDRGTARRWVDGKPVEEPLRPGGVVGGYGEVTG